MTFLQQLIHWDERLTLWLNMHSPAFLDPFWTAISGIPIWIPLYVLTVIYMFWRMRWKKGLVLLLAAILTIVLTDQFSYQTKEFLQRLRPCHNAWMLEHGLRLPAGTNHSLYGFFSGHACNCFGFANFTYTAFRKSDPHHAYGAWGWFIYLWAGFIAWSRIVLGAHFLGDILVGTAVGLTISYALAQAASRIILKAKL